MKYLTVFHEGQMLWESDDSNDLVIKADHIPKPTGCYIRLHFKHQGLDAWYQKRPDGLNDFVEPSQLPKELKLLLLLMA